MTALSFRIISFATAGSSAHNVVKPTDLDPDTRRDLLNQLDKYRDDIQEKYASFVVSLCKAVEATGVSVEEFQLYVNTLSAKEKDHVTDLTVLFDSIKVKIMEAKSITLIFNLLANEYCSFLNVGIFQSIIKKYEINTDSDEDLQYFEHLKTYLHNHKLSVLILN